MGQSRRAVLGALASVACTTGLVGCSAVSDDSPDPRLDRFDRAAPAAVVTNAGGRGPVHAFLRFRHGSALVDVRHRHATIDAGATTRIDFAYESFPGVACGPDEVRLYGGPLAGTPAIRFESAPMVECREGREFVPVRFRNEGELGHARYTLTVETEDGTTATGGPWTIPVEPHAPGADSWGFIHRGSEVVDVQFEPVTPS